MRISKSKGRENIYIVYIELEMIPEILKNKGKIIGEEGFVWRDRLKKGVTEMECNGNR